MFHRLFAVILLAFLGCLVGCGSGPSQSEAEEESHFPPHWPGDILVAKERVGEIAKGNRHPTNVELFTELQDVVKWLPELAADSDLDEKAFHEIDNAAQNLLAVLDAIESKEEASISKEMIHREEFKQLVDTLDRLVSEATVWVLPEGIPRPSSAISKSQEKSENLQQPSSN